MSSYAHAYASRTFVTLPLERRLGIKYTNTLRTRRLAPTSPSGAPSSA